QPPRIGPMQRVAQGRSFDTERAVDLERRLRTERAIEGCLYGRAVKPDFDAGTFPAQRGEEVAERKARVDLLVMPHETAAGAETARNGRPGELKLNAVQPLGALLCGAGLMNDNRAVLNADFRE